jgi:uncharacterized protein YqjF (DUF2071 family)
VTDQRFDRGILDVVAHRPWPMPDGPWIMTQTWHGLLFAHWPVAADAIAARVPTEFPLDLFEGTAWLGIVPFQMTNVSLRGLPSLPWVSAFPELNVRTYVRVDDRPGVYFFSLDAGSALAVQAARSLLSLPYYAAAMNVTLEGTVIGYESQREDALKPATLSASYRPRGPVFQPVLGTLEYFLTERYCLYNRDHRGAPYRLDIHHPPWSVQVAEAEFRRNTMAEAAGISMPDVAPLLHFAQRQDAVAWAPCRL